LNWRPNNVRKVQPETVLELGKQLGVLQREPIDTRPSGVTSIDGSGIQFGTMG